MRTSLGVRSLATLCLLQSGSVPGYVQQVVPSEEDRLAARYHGHLEILNVLLADPLFTDSSSSSLISVGLCKVEYHAKWTESASKNKGYASVRTLVPIDLEHDVESADFVPAHVIPGEGTTTFHWDDTVRIDFARKLQGKFTSRALDSHEETANPYSVSFVSIGVEDPSKTDGIEILVDTLNRLIRTCRR